MNLNWNLGAVASLHPLSPYTHNTQAPCSTTANLQRGLLWLPSSAGPIVWLAAHLQLHKITDVGNLDLLSSLQ
jgi:hypothetical protein